MFLLFVVLCSCLFLCLFVVLYNCLVLGLCLLVVVVNCILCDLVLMVFCFVFVFVYVECVFVVNVFLSSTSLLFDILLVSFSQGSPVCGLQDVDQYIFLCFWCCFVVRGVFFHVHVVFLVLISVAGM